MNEFIVVMGVAGCGKSSLGRAIANITGLRLVEGDDHHGTANLEKMSAGLALTDADREGWLSALAQELRSNPDGLVLTCSALKRAYRDHLRAAAEGLRFVFLEIGRLHALDRVTARSPTHFFSASLVDSQFSTLEPPTAEPRVLRLDALAPLTQLQTQVMGWLKETENQ
jgi:gluconokinase